MRHEQLVNQDMAGRLIGRGGLGIRELRDSCRAQIRIESQCEPGTNSRKVAVFGEPANVQVGLAMIAYKLAQMEEGRRAIS